MVNHEIKSRIHEEADLFFPYDPDENLLSEDVISVWEATNICLVERPELVRTRHHLKKLADSRIIITQPK